MGTVWEAEHTGLQTRVAVKRLQREHAGRDQSRLRFIREAQSAAAVKHPHVVEIFDVSTDEHGDPYIVMELLDGEPLSEVLRRDGPMPWARAYPILTQLISALRCAHANDVVHRDLKPSNIMIMRSGTVDESCKIIDFGLAKPNSPEPGAPQITHTGDLFGSPGYMSPEQLRGEPIDARSDVYALGCVAFELLTGQRPFVGPSVADLTVQHLTHPAPALGSIEAPKPIIPAIAALVQRALAKHPRDRHDSMSELADELRQVAEYTSSVWARCRTFTHEWARPVAVATGGLTLGLVLWLASAGARGHDSPTDEGAFPPFTRELARPVEQDTPPWPSRWLGAELGLPEPRRDGSTDRTGAEASGTANVIWAADPRAPVTYRLVTDSNDMLSLSRLAVRRGLTLGHAVDDPDSAERLGREGDPSTGRVFYTEPDTFPLRAVGTVHLGPNCAGVQIGPVHILTSAHCLWRVGAALPKDGADWRAGPGHDDDASAVDFVRVYVPQQWPQHDRAGAFDWAVAITERRVGTEYFGITPRADDALTASPLHHKGYPVEHDPTCELRSPVRWARGANRPWGNPTPIELTGGALRAPSPISGWSRVLATSQVTSVGHGGGPYYYYDPSRRPVVVGIHRSGCTEADGGSPEFCGWTGPWHCGIDTALPSQATRLEPNAVYGHILPILTWWGVDDAGRAVCLLRDGC
ncbi:MAG: serine/threonine protein kinase [Deltaproteobacteria bacterium]|nr:serine/threonine protein kinase [Deltaproteobacteria bacterium]